MGWRRREFVVRIIPPSHIQYGLGSLAYLSPHHSPQAILAASCSVSGQYSSTRRSLGAVVIDCHSLFLSLMSSVLSSPAPATAHGLSCLSGWLPFKRPGFRQHEAEHSAQDLRYSGPRYNRGRDLRHKLNSSTLLFQALRYLSAALWRFYPHKENRFGS